MIMTLAIYILIAGSVGFILTMILSVLRVWPPGSLRRPATYEAEVLARVSVATLVLGALLACVAGALMIPGMF
jgi:hypothetical protein